MLGLYLGALGMRQLVVRTKQIVPGNRTPGGQAESTSGQPANGDDRH